MMKRLLATAALTLGLVGGTATAADLSSMSWDEIVSQAKEEGQVSWFIWYFQPRFREFVKPFEEEYGISVQVPEGTEDGNFNKLVAERGRETGDIDVMAHPTGTLKKIKVADFFYQLDGVLPDMTNLTIDLGGNNSQGYSVAFWGNQSGIAYDPTKIDEADLPQTVDEIAAFMKDRPGEFGINYENGGSGPAFVRAMARNQVPSIDWVGGEVSDQVWDELQPVWAWFRDLGPDFVITASNADTLVRINDGELALGPAWEDHLAGLQAQGEIDKRLKFYIPKFGMKGDGTMVSIPLNAPHPAAAAVFIDWLTKPETQSRFNQIFGSVPMHPDASDEFALVPQAQRANRTVPVGEPLATDIINAFIENVALEL